MKLKKLISTALAASIVAGSASAISSLAASPKIYVNFVYEDSDTIRADVMFEGMPELSSVGIHIQFGEGYDVVLSSSGKPMMFSDCIFKESNGVTEYLYEDYDNSVFFAWGDSEAKDCNGVYASFYVTKSSSYTSSNATANLLVKDGDLLKNIEIDDTVNYLPGASDTSPIMLKSYEYIIGDANGDHTVDAVDASYVSIGLGNQVTISVAEIEDCYTDFFPYAEAPAAPDATQNGYINKADANEILDYYSAKATGSSYTGYAGNKNIYEIFD